MSDSIQVRECDERRERCAGTIHGRMDAFVVKLTGKLSMTVFFASMSIVFGLLAILYYCQQDFSRDIGGYGNRITALEVVNSRMEMRQEKMDAKLDSILTAVKKP